MELFVIWVVAAVLVAAWCSNRGGSFLLALVVSVAFSPLVGLIPVALAPGGRLCPACQGRVRDKALKCLHCGEALPCG